MALPVATWTGQKIVTVVSRFVGLSNDSNSRSAALDYVNLALWEISLHTPWDWLCTTASDITVASGTADYNLPTATGSEFDEIYDCRLIGTNERTLEYIDRRSYDNAIRGSQDSANIPTHYTVYGAQQGAVITLLPTPSAADTLRIRYIARQQTLSDASASTLAMSDKYVPLVIYKAAELVSAWKVPEIQQFWTMKYNSILNRAIDRDRNKDDAKTGFVPQIEHGATRVDAVNPDDLSFYPR